MASKDTTCHTTDGALGPIRRILVGTSLDLTDSFAVKNAAALATALDASVHVHHSIPNPPLPYGTEYGIIGTEWMRSLLKRTEKLLAAEVLVATQAGVKEVTSTFEVGEPYRDLLTHASRIGADLIVVGASESKRLLGSVPDRLIRKATCPVLIARGDDAPPYQRILAPVDLSELCGDSFRCALCFLEQLHQEGPTTVEPLFVLTKPQGSMVTQFPLERFELFARDELARFVDQQAGETQAFRFEHKLRMGEPRAEIIAESLEKDTDLIVIGTHGRSGLERALIGSVTEGVVRNTQANVLVIPPTTAFGAALVDAVAEQLEPHFDLGGQEVAEEASDTATR